MDDDELRKIILSDNSLFQRLKTRMLENPDKILDYVKDSDLKNIILSDSKFYLNPMENVYFIFLF